MSTSRNEKLSAFVDNELTTEEMQCLELDEVQQSTWMRYNLIGDVMRDDVPAQLQFDITDRIADALENEATLVSLEQKKASFGQRVVDKLANVTQFPVLQRTVQVGVAATVAAVAVVGVNQYAGQQEVLEDTSPIPVLQTIPTAGSASPVSLSTQRPILEQRSQSATLQQQRLNSAYFEHQKMMKLKQTQVEAEKEDKDNKQQ